MRFFHLPAWIALSTTMVVMVLALALAVMPIHAETTYSISSVEVHVEVDALQEAVHLLTSLGVPHENLCRTTVVYGSERKEEEAVSSLLPRCKESPSSTAPSRSQPTRTSTSLTSSSLTSSSLTSSSSSSTSSSWVRSRRQRYLQEELLVAKEGDDEEDEQEDYWFFIAHAVCAFFCVVTAALAAGLTMGLLSLDPLMLLIKVRAAATQTERDQAASLLPIVKQHHLLLVTLLLLNSIANEALPLFLEVLVSPLVAVLLSVTLVLFFGEIIPSAIFTGPNKVKIAARMVPVVKFVMFLLWPISYPIAKLLDHVLHDDDHDAGSAFDRGELSALVRIQYEERMAHKKRKKEEKKQLSLGPITTPTVLVDNVGALDFTTLQIIKASKKNVDRCQSKLDVASASSSDRNTTEDNHDNDPVLTSDTRRSTSIHVDEVSMVEGALSMKTKVALDVFTPLHRMFSIPYDMILNEPNVVQIYSSGFSRIPVFQPNPQKPRSTIQICGILMTKQLIVVNPTGQRPLSTLPLATPTCVGPKLNLIDLLNLFQTGQAGHLALVCARPQVAQDLISNGQPLTEAAGLMGIITLEDVLEALLQEQIYDESDKMEREALRISKWAAQKWRNFLKRRKRDRALARGEDVANISMGTLVEEAMAVDERTGLLSGHTTTNNSNNNNPISGIVKFFGNLTNNNNNNDGDIQ